MGRYARAVARFPYVFLVVDIVLALVAGPITVWIHGVPDLSDPSKGFEPRGTEIKGWQHTAQFVREAIDDGRLTPWSQNSTNSSENSDVQGGSTRDRSVRDSQDAGGKLPGSQTTRQQQNDQPFDPIRHARLVVTPTQKGSSLMSVDYIHAICRLQDEFLDPPCHHDNQLCDVTSLGTLTSQFLNKSCSEITQNDVDDILELVSECAGFVFADTVRQETPARCVEQGYVYSLVRHYSDKQFTQRHNHSRLGALTYSPIFLRWRGSEPELEDFYKTHLHQKDLSNDLVAIRGMELLLGRSMFRWFVKQDIVWYGLAMILVIVILVIYLSSPSLMFTIILNVAFTLSLAYWFYFMVCRFTFFPFINILAALLLIAVSADDLFIFYDIWRSQKRATPSMSHEALVSTVLQKGGMSVFVTSLTTAAALLANLINDVTAIRCFGVFAAVCIMMNFLLFITWVPAILVILERVSKACEAHCRCCDSQCNFECCDRCSRAKRTLWSKIMPRIVSRGAPAWIVISVLVSVGAFLVTFWRPRLNLPTSNKFRSLVPSHPFEVYSWELADHFWFEANDVSNIHIVFMFGVHGQDNGDLLDANNIGHLVFDRQFDIYQHSSQIWLRDFCQDLLKQDFVDKQFSSSVHCFWDQYAAFIQSSCTLDVINEVQPTECCNATFPTNPNTSHVCSTQFSSNKDVINSTSVTGQPLVDQGGHIRMFQMIVPTSFEWSASYEVSDATYSRLSGYLKDRLQTAPPGLDSGGFSGVGFYEFRFYDLQTVLARGTISGIGLSLAIGFAVLLLTTLNVVLSLYAITVITFVLVTTAGTLALMGWELGASEALTLTLSMGLSIDFTIHLGVAYNLESSNVRTHRVQQALDTVGSAVTMAALTTFSAGAAMLLGQVWAYRQFGTFLVLTMVFSWFYAIFFFMSICSVIGPINNIGNIKAIFRRRPTARYETEKKSNVPAISSHQPDRIRQATVENGGTLSALIDGIPTGRKRDSLKHVISPRGRPESVLPDNPGTLETVSHSNHGTGSTNLGLGRSEHGTNSTNRGLGRVNPALDDSFTDPPPTYSENVAGVSESTLSMARRDIGNVMLY